MGVKLSKGGWKNWRKKKREKNREKKMNLKWEPILRGFPPSPSTASAVG
jgi:hypothetical protein